MHSPSPFKASRIIAAEAGGKPFAAWLAGLSLAMLACGTYGALHPLLPPVEDVFQTAGDNDDIAILDFQPASGGPAPQELAIEQETPPEDDVEIPPVPEIAAVLTPPEMPDLLEQENPPAKLPVRPSSQPKAETKHSRQASPQAHTAAGGRGDGSSPTLMSGIGGGRFPAPSYPSAARALRQQGMVRLLINVETNGLPTSVDVLSSSGSGLLDNAALDQVRRRWRWPSGPERKYIAPIRFEIR